MFGRTGRWRVTLKRRLHKSTYTAAAMFDSFCGSDVLTTFWLVGSLLFPPHLVHFLLATGVTVPTHFDATAREYLKILKAARKTAPHISSCMRIFDMHIQNSQV